MMLKSVPAFAHGCPWTWNPSQPPNAGGGRAVRRGLIVRLPVRTLAVHTGGFYNHDLRIESVSDFQ